MWSLFSLSNLQFSLVLIYDIYTVLLTHTLLLCGFRKSQPDVQLTDFAEEEEFECLVKELSTDVSAAEYIDLFCKKGIPLINTF